MTKHSEGKTNEEQTKTVPLSIESNNVKPSPGVFPPCYAPTSSEVTLDRSRRCCRCKRCYQCSGGKLYTPPPPPPPPATHDQPPSNFAPRTTASTTHLPGKTLALPHLDTIFGYYATPRYTTMHCTALRRVTKRCVRVGDTIFSLNCDG